MVKVSFVGVPISYSCPQVYITTSAGDAEAVVGHDLLSVSSTLKTWLKVSQF